MKHERHNTRQKRQDLRCCPRLVRRITGFRRRCRWCGRCCCSSGECSTGSHYSSGTKVCKEYKKEQGREKVSEGRMLFECFITQSPSQHQKQHKFKYVNLLLISVLASIMTKQKNCRVFWRNFCKILSNLKVITRPHESSEANDGTRFSRSIQKEALVCNS